MTDLEIGAGAPVAIPELSIAEGEIVAVLGANGAGKSTLLRAVMGLAPPARGRIEFLGRDLAGRPTDERARMGLAYVAEGRRIFPGMSLYDNLAVACPADRHERARRIAEICRLFPPLLHKEHMPAWQLSGGQQQMLAIGRALMGDPLLLLLDEPSLGLAPKIVRDLLARLRDIAARGTAVLIAEQNAAAALEIADRAVIMRAGKVAASGPAARLRADSAALISSLGL
ncbi:MAG: ABC transporter ATP-binding protein [Rhodospirillales bacterium]|nr:ABC transporter ATP-binding protein [Rhodospirillales bacterium]